MVSRKDQNENPFVADAKNIIDVPVNDEVSKSFMEYAFSTVYSRALVDALDGLKPVARRILYSMFKDGYTPDKNYVKSARPVASTMGSYHPHGDSSIYDAMAKLAQPWYLNVKFVDGYGNWGDAGGSSPAASRYTECKLDRAALLLLEEIRENTVDMRPNYDGEDEEPVVLPVQFPVLLVNGAFGIAVGFSSNMAPHNPTEVIDAARWLLTHPNADLDKLMTFIPGPDFPTGGQVLGMDGVRESYETGRGSIRIRSTVTIEAAGRGRHELIFTELPYGVKTESIIAKVKEQLKQGKLQGVADIQDLTDRNNGTRLVVETKTGVNPNALLLDLYKNTPLEETFAINNIALVNGEPKVLGLKEQLEIFIAHRIDIVTRRSQFRKEKREARLHLIEGLLKALADIDEVIRIVRGSADATIAQASLIKKFKIDEIQANYILELQLRRLTKFDQIQLNDEKKRLLDELKELNAILNDEKVLRDVIGKELEAVRKVLDRPRRTVLVGGNLAEHLEAAKVAATQTTLEIPDEPCFVVLTHKGGVVRTDKAPTKPVLSVAETTTRGKFVAVTNKGRAFRIDSIHATNKESSASNVLPTRLAAGEKLVALTPVALADGKTGGIAMGTRLGNVKITAPQWPVRSDEFSVIGLDGDDEVIGAAWVPDVNAADLVFVTEDTSLLTFPASKVRPQGLSGSGMAGIKLPADIEVVSFNVVPHEVKDKAVVVTISDQNRGKVTEYPLYPQKGRATGGVRSMKFLKGETKLVRAYVGAQPMILSADGKVVALPPTDKKRDGSGVPLDDGSLGF